MQIFVNGTITGLGIATLAVAFSAVFLPTRTFHIALGGSYAAAPYIAWAVMGLGWPSLIAVLCSVATGIVLSLACEMINHAPLERQGASSGAHLVSSLGLYILIVETLAITWGNEAKVLREGIDSTITLGGISLTRSQLLGGIVSGSLLTLFYLWLRSSQIGLQFRALADNPKEFALLGFNVRKLRLLAFGIAGLLASSISILIAYDLGFDPHGGLTALLLAIVAVILGGRQSFLGPVLGGLLLGIVRTEVVWILSAKWQDGVTFALLALFLFLKPNGILGARQRIEAER